VCVGIDPVLERLPAELAPRARTSAAAAGAVERFGRDVLDAVAAHVPAVKLNIAFFEAFHAAGIAAFQRLISYAHERGLLVIADIKRGDIGSTAQFYARGHLERSAFEDIPESSVPDAVTLSGYLGAGSVKPFIEAAKRTGRGMFVLVRPSDPGADEVHDFGGERPFYRHMAKLVDAWGSDAAFVGEYGLSCVGAVVAPKDAESTAELRAAMPRTIFLVPGYGAQGAGAEACRPCFLTGGRGAIVNASRSVIYAYEEPRYSEKFGQDWRKCVSAAAAEFCAEITRVVQAP
jgi:orotidine-5'-phosphate decarboxylase